MQLPKRGLRRALLVSTDLSVAEEPQPGQRRMGVPAPERR